MYVNINSVWAIDLCVSVRLFWPIVAKNSLQSLLKPLTALACVYLGLICFHSKNIIRTNDCLRYTLRVPPSINICCFWLYICSSLFLTRWQSPPDSTSWMKTAGPSGLLEPPPMVMPKLLDRATEMSWITPSPGWLKTQRHISTSVFKVKKGCVWGLKNPLFLRV